MYHRRFLLIFILFGVYFCQPVYAEAPGHTLKTTFGGPEDDRCFSLTQTHDAGYILVGNTKSFGAGGIDVYVVKVDQQCDEQWNLTWGYTRADNAFSVQETTDRGYIIGGTHLAGPTKDEAAFLLKLNRDGVIDWNRTYYDRDNYQCWDVIQTVDGGYLLTGLKWNGIFTQQPDDDPNVFLIKTDKSGNVEWNQTYRLSTDDRAFAVVETGDAGYLMAGNTKPFEEEHDRACLTKVDSSGELLWSRYYGGENGQWFEDVIMTKDSGFAAVGWQLKGNHTGSGLYIVKVDSQGEELWSGSFSGNRSAIGSSIIELETGNLIAVGTTSVVGADQHDVYVVSVDSEGSFLWEGIYGGNDRDVANSVTTSIRGDIVIGGESRSSGNGEDDMYLLKLGTEKDPGFLTGIPAVPLISILLALSIFISVKRQI